MVDTRDWRGYAVAVAQVDTAPVGGTIEVGDLFNCTINDKTLSVAATTTVAATTATDIETAWNLSTIPEFAEITASTDGANLILTGDTAGKPFTLAVEATGDHTFTVSTTTAATGPHYWDNDDNWTSSDAPDNTDNVVIDGDVDILHGLDQSAVTLTNLYIKASYTGDIGLPRINTDNTNGPYVEYRDRSLQIGAANIHIGRGNGNRSERIRLDSGAVAVAVYVYGTGTTSIDGDHAVEWKGTNVANTITVHGGDVGIATDSPGDSAVVAYLVTDSPAGNTVVTCGLGAQIGSLTHNGGAAYVAKMSSSVFTQRAGTLVIATDATGTFTSVTIEGGTCYDRSTLDPVALSVGGGGTIDYSLDARLRTVTACVVYQGANIQDPHKSVTWSAGIDLTHCELADVTLNLGTHFTLTPSAI